MLKNQLVMILDEGYNYSLDDINEKVNKVIENYRNSDINSGETLISDTQMFPIGIDIFPEYEGPEPIYTEGDMYIDFSSGGSVYIK